MIRVLRTFHWVPEVPKYYGGKTTYSLESTDTLQYLDITDTLDFWKDVPTVEAEKPEHPEETQARILRENTARLAQG